MSFSPSSSNDNMSGVGENTYGTIVALVFIVLVILFVITCYTLGHKKIKKEDYVLKPAEQRRQTIAQKRDSIFQNIVELTESKRNSSIAGSNSIVNSNDILPVSTSRIFYNESLPASHPEEMPEGACEGAFTQSSVVSFIKASTIRKLTKKETFRIFLMRSYPPKFIWLIIRLQTKFRTRLTWRLYQNFLRDTSPLIQSQNHKSKLTCVGGTVVVWSFITNIWLLLMLLWGMYSASYPPKSLSANDFQYSRIGNLKKEYWDNVESCPYQGTSNVCAFNTTGNPFSPAVRQQQIYENQKDSNVIDPPAVRFTLLHHFPHFEGLIWQIGVVAHLSTGCILFFLFPFAANDIRQREKILGNMSNAAQKLHYPFGKWGPNLALLHHYLLLLQCTFGLLLGTKRYIKRGFNAEKWYAFEGFKLDLYLQFFSLAALGAVSISQVVLLRIYGLDFEGKSRICHKSLLYFTNLISLAVEFLSPLCYFYYCFPMNPDPAFAAMFIIQCPLCAVFTQRAMSFWEHKSIGDRLFMWQAAINRGAIVCLFISSTTFLANVFMRMDFQLGTGVAYLIGNVMWIYTSWYMDKVLKVRGHEEDNTVAYCMSWCFCQAQKRV
jgi:hypothetical protein